MIRKGILWLALGLLTFHGTPVRAQNSLDILEEELKTAKQQHEDMTAADKVNLFGQVDQAKYSPDAAFNLYQQAGGTMPDPSPIITQHESETPTEREARIALDQAALSKLGLLLQLHCGLMHFAALFVVDPKKEGLQQEWVAWLQKAAQSYIQLGSLSPNNGGGNERPPGEAPVHHHHHEPAAAADNGLNGGGGGPPPAQSLSLAELKAKSMRDSIISKALHFRSWGASEQGGWAVEATSRPGSIALLSSDPARTPPTATTLADWDVYIAMRSNSDERDSDHWNTIVNPPLQDLTVHLR